MGHHWCNSNWKCIHVTLALFLLSRVPFHPSCVPFCGLTSHGWNLPEIPNQSGWGQACHHPQWIGEEIPREKFPEVEANLPSHCAADIWWQASQKCQFVTVQPPARVDPSKEPEDCRTLGDHRWQARSWAAVWRPATEWGFFFQKEEGHFQCKWGDNICGHHPSRWPGHWVPCVWPKACQKWFVCCHGTNNFGSCLRPLEGREPEGIEHAHQALQEDQEGLREVCKELVEKKWFVVAPCSASLCKALNGSMFHPLHCLVALYIAELFVGGASITKSQNQFAKLHVAMHVQFVCHLQTLAWNNHFQNMSNKQCSPHMFATRSKCPQGFKPKNHKHMCLWTQKLWPAAKLAWKPCLQCLPKWSRRSLMLWHPTRASTSSWSKSSNAWKQILWHTEWPYCQNSFWHTQTTEGGPWFPSMMFGRKVMPCWQ